MGQLDVAMMAAAVVCRMRYEDVKTAVKQHDQGFQHLRGTGYYEAVLAWRAADYALSHSPLGDAAIERGQAGEGSL